MAIDTFSNTIAMPDRRQSVQEAVLAGIGTRPESETWKVFICEPASGPEYVIKIEGPNFKWEHTFCGFDQQTPEFIRNDVRKAIP